MVLFNFLRIFISILLSIIAPQSLTAGIQDERRLIQNAQESNRVLRVYRIAGATSEIEPFVKRLEAYSIPPDITKSCSRSEYATSRGAVRLVSHV